MEYIDIRGTSQENIAKEVEEIAKRRGMELEFKVKLQWIVIYLIHHLLVSFFLFFRIFGVSVVVYVVVTIPYQMLLSSYFKQTNHICFVFYY